MHYATGTNEKSSLKKLPFDIFVVHLIYPWQVALQQSLLPFKLINKDEKKIFFESHMPKKNSTKKCFASRATPFLGEFGYEKKVKKLRDNC